MIDKIIIVIGSEINLSLITKLIKNEKTIVVIIPENDKEVRFGNEFAIIPFRKINLNFPVELLKIAKPKLRTKRVTEKVVAQNKTLSNHQKTFFKRRRK